MIVNFDVGDDSNSQMTDSVFDTGDSVGNTRGSVRSSWESSGSALSFESAAERGPHIRFLLGVLKVGLIYHEKVFEVLRT